MAQFDVHRNRGRNRDDIPYVVVVQSSLFDNYKRRVVIPLVKKTSLAKIDNTHFNPSFRIKNVSVVLHPLEIVSVSVDSLGERVASLSQDGDSIVDALDELLTRAWK